MAIIRLDEQTTPATPPAGKTTLFIDSADSKAKIIDDTGTVTDLTNAGAVDSVNTQTGAVVLDADDIDDTSTAHKFVTGTDITNLGNLSGTNSGDEVSATTSVEGIVERATDAEVAAGTDTTRYISPAQLSIYTKPFATATPAAASVVDFTSGINSTGAIYELEWWGVTVSTNGAALWLRTDADGGASFDAGGGDYEISYKAIDANGTTFNFGSNGLGQIIIARNIWNAAGSSCNGTVRLWFPSNAATRTMVDGHSVYFNDLDEPETMQFGGARDVAGTVNALRVLPSAGTVSGNFALRRIRTS